jgi:membrane protease YdiL (CAAX protease family)
VRGAGGGESIAAVLVVLTAANVWVHVGPRRAHLLTQPVAGVLLLALGRRAGLSWADLGLAVGAAGAGVLVGVIGAILIATGYALALAVPALRGAFLDTRYHVGLRSALRIALVEIPLSTVLLEEIAFRGVVWGLLAADGGRVAATAVSSALFGVWHVLPALDLARTSTAIGGRGLSWRRRVTVVGTTVLGTAIAGVLLAELRRRTGSLLAPIAIHWAANAIGVLASAWAWGRQVRSAAEGGSPVRDEAPAPAADDSEAVPRQGRES